MTGNAISQAPEPDLQKWLCFGAFRTRTLFSLVPQIFLQLCPDDLQNVSGNVDVQKNWHLTAHVTIWAVVLPKGASWKNIPFWMFRGIISLIPGDFCLPHMSSSGFKWYRFSHFRVHKMLPPFLRKSGNKVIFGTFWFEILVRRYSEFFCESFRLWMTKCKKKAVFSPKSTRKIYGIPMIFMGIFWESMKIHWIEWKFILQTINYWFYEFPSRLGPNGLEDSRTPWGAVLVKR